MEAIAEKVRTNAPLFTLSMPCCAWHHLQAASCTAHRQLASSPRTLPGRQSDTVGLIWHRRLATASLCCIAFISSTSTQPAFLCCIAFISSTSTQPASNQHVCGRRRGKRWALGREQGSRPRAWTRCTSRTPRPLLTRSTCASTRRPCAGWRPTCKVRYWPPACAWRSCTVYWARTGSMHEMLLPVWHACRSVGTLTASWCVTHAGLMVYDACWRMLYAAGGLDQPNCNQLAPSDVALQQSSQHVSAGSRPAGFMYPKTESTEQRITCRLRLPSTSMLFIMTLPPPDTPPLAPCGRLHHNQYSIHWL
jgi:hypothetical protein